MRRDSRLSFALHALLHMGDSALLITSDSLGTMMEKNPVVRRTMGGLRAAGIVRSEKGHGGGWSLARELRAITLGDVYDALGIPSPFRIGPREESPGCLVEQAVDRALGGALREAETLLLARLRSITLADLAADVAATSSHRKKTPGARRTHPHA